MESFHDYKMADNHSIVDVGVSNLTPTSKLCVFWALDGVSGGRKFILFRAEHPYFQSSAAYSIGTVDDQSS
jgi:hypothetical protein